MTDPIYPPKRSVRRHHRERMIVHAQHSLIASPREPEDRLDWARRNHDHLKICSCWMCGNPRKYAGLPPIQERRLLQEALAAIADTGSA